MPLHQSKTLEDKKWKVTQVTPSLEPKNGLPALVDEINFCNILGFNGKFPWFVVHHQDLCYRKFYIDKVTKQIHQEPNPDLNLRTISAPAPALKELQGRIAATYLSKLPRHEANFAYMKGKNIKMAAETHKDGDVLIRIDLKDFFPSHREGYIRNRLHEITGYSKELCWFISKVCTLDGGLPQGAATSPILSIVLNYDMDAALAALAVEHNFIYTRYADDLCFSGVDRDNKSCWAFVKEVSRIVTPFRINWEKVEVMRMKAYSYAYGVEVKGAPPHVIETIKERYGKEPWTLTEKGNSILVSKAGREPLEHDATGDFKVGTLEEIQHTIQSFDLEVNYVTAEKRWYVQSIKRMLGLHLTTGVHFPRNKYNQLRLEAMLVAKGATNVNPQKFKGRLAFLRMVDPEKAKKIDKIMEKHGGK